MSAASLLKVYDGVDTELSFLTAGPGGNQDLAQVLAVGNSANELAIADVASILGGTAGTLLVSSAPTQSLSLAGAVGASLVAATADATVEATAGNVDITSTAGTLTLSAPSPSGDLILDLPAGKLTAASAVAGNAITNLITRQLEITINGTSYFIPLSSSAFP